MRVLLINCVCGIKSTGRICTELAEKIGNEGHEVKIAYGREELVPEKYKKYAVRIGNDLDVKLHAIRTRILDEHGFGSKKATREFLKWADEFNPDMVWLHNIHGYYINVELLFEWIKSRPNMQVKWTLHDCWPFTGHCAHFEPINCHKWKSQCKKCELKTDYPTSWLMDQSKKNYLRKKKSFLGVKNLILVTPSKWLAEMLKQSYLKDYDVITIPNGIDIKLFKPINKERLTGKKEFLSKKYQIDFSKKIFIGVASVWTKEKGFDDFIKISKMNLKNIQIVLVGVSKAQKDILPQGIIGIERTENQQELAELYACADVFLNPTYADTFPTVNMEAISCGTPVVTYNTCGSPESVLEGCGAVVEKGNYKKMIEEAMQLSKIEDLSLALKEFDKDLFASRYYDVIMRNDRDEKRD